MYKIDCKNYLNLFDLNFKSRNLFILEKNLEESLEWVNFTNFL